MKFLPIYFLLFVVFMTSISRKRNTIRSITATQILKRKDCTFMLEAAKKFIGIKCYVKTINEDLKTGTLKGISGKTLILETTDSRVMAINAEYVTCIEEYPTSKKEKKNIIKDFFFAE